MGLISVSVFSNFMKKTIIGGIIFLIPLALLLFAAGELFDALSGISDKIGDVLFPNSDAANNFVPDFACDPARSCLCGRPTGRIWLWQPTR